MRLQFRNISIVASAVLTSTLLFTGCGGGGSSDDTTAVAASTTISGKAVDGYLKSSVVWLDLDADGVLDSNEPSDVSDENGNFTLKITAAVKNDPGFPTAKIVAEGGVDKDTGKQFNGKLLAPNTGSTEINLSPVTTLVAKLVEKGEDVKKAEEKVKKSLGISEHVDLFDDPKELEKNGNTELIAAALSLQKSIEMIASAASGDDEEKAAEIQDKLYEAFAKVLAEETGESTEGGEETGEGVSGLLEAAKKSEALGDVDVDESHLDKAKELAEEVEKAVEEGHDSGDVEKAAALYTEQNSISGTVTLPDFNDLVSKTDELKKKFLVYRLETLGLEDTETLAAALLAEGLDADKLINPTEETLQTLKNSEKFQNVYAALIKERKEVEEKTEETTAAAGETAFAIKAGDAFYEVDVDEEDGKLEIEFQTHTLNTDGTVGEKERVFVDGEWKEDVDDNDDYILTSQGWVKEKGNETYKINADGSVTINNAFKVSIAKEKDISGKYTLVLDDKVFEIDMPAGAKEYVNTYETVADQYWMWEKERAWGIDGQEYYTSLEEFITHQCGEHWFEGNHEGGVAFAGTDNGDGTYTCDGSATSGKLFEVKGGDETHPSTIVSEDAGTWEIKTVNGVKILFVHPSNPEYSDDHGETIFTEFDGAVWRGEYETAGKKETWHSFNEIAFKTIADYVENMASSSGNGSDSTTTPVGDLATLLAGKTFYTTIYDENRTLESWTFAGDMSSASWREIVGGSAYGSGTISVSGSTITYTCTSDSEEACETDPTIIEVKEVADDYVAVEVSGGELNGEVEKLRLYYDRSKAEAYFNALGGDSTSSDEGDSGDVNATGGMSEEELALLNASPIFALSAGYTFYEVEAEKEDGDLEVEVMLHTLNQDGTITEVEKYFDAGDWIDDDDDGEDLVLTDQGWKPENIEKYVIQSDGSIIIDGKFRIAVVKETDIAGTYSYQTEYGSTVDIEMPAGAKEYKNLYEAQKAQYYIYDKVRTHGNIQGQEYYTSFNEFITHQCGYNWFVGHESGGLAFAGTDDGNGGYTCDGSAKTGTLVVVRSTDNGSEIVSTNGGTWEIKNVNGYDIMFIHPSNPEFNDDQGGHIFTVHDGTLWTGEYEIAGIKDIWTSYNKTAFEAITKAVEENKFQ